MYSIGAFAQLTGLSVKTLRHDERLGLVVPVRTGARYRRYSLSDLRRLDRVRALRSLGLPLREVGLLLKGEAVPLAPHRDRLEKERANLDRAISALTRIEQHPHSAEAIDRFVADAAWDRWETERTRRGADDRRPPDQAPESQTVMFKEIAVALTETPVGGRAWDLAAQYRVAIGPEGMTALIHRGEWPAGTRQWAASLVEAAVEDWERVMDFVTNAWAGSTH